MSFKSGESHFYNTTAPGIILLLNKSKQEERKGQILLVNASRFYQKQKPKNVLTDEGIQVIADVYRAWESREKISKVVGLKDVEESDFNLSPSQFVDVGQVASHRALYEIMDDLEQARIEREEADRVLASVLSGLTITLP